MATDPNVLTLGLLEVTAVVEGIKFLYTQAGELLKKLNGRTKEGKADDPTPISVEVRFSTNADAAPAPIGIAPATLSAYAEQLKSLRKRVSDKAEGLQDVDLGDAEFLADVSALRELMETVLGRQIDFRGEHRPHSSATSVEGRVYALEVHGDAAGVRAELITGGRTSGEGISRLVGKGGSLTGVSAKRVS